MINKSFVLILWRWSCFHQSRNHLFNDVSRWWVRFKHTITLNIISLVDEISCFSNDRIKSSETFFSWFCNTLLCSSFFLPELRWMKAVNVFTFTLKIRAATALLSVGFSFKNFFACSIPSVMVVEMRFILIWKGVCFDPKRGLQMGCKWSLEIW